jgi:integrase
MARTLNKLTARQVATIRDTGRHADGGGLYLRVTPAGARSWVFMATTAGRRQEIGLGAAAALPLAAARELAAGMREAIATGRKPREVLRPTITAVPVVPTFGAFADSYIASVEAGWKNPVHRQQWRNSLRDHADALADVPIDQVDTERLLAVLRPIWLTKAETAGRVRGRIERILDAAKARGLRPVDALNPATLRGHLALLLPRQPGMARGHHPALPYAEAPAFMAALRGRLALAARCLEFLILTAARSGEALDAQWREMDLSRRLWTVPAARMKAKQEHIVPLSGSALAVLEALMPPDGAPTGRVFAVAGASRSNMAMAMLLRRMNMGHVTVHGFRSTFRDWAGDETSYPRELVEQALAHTINNKAERAYRRGTAIERRRELMEHWAGYLLP